MNARSRAVFPMCVCARERVHLRDSIYNLISILPSVRCSYFPWRSSSNPWISRRGDAARAGAHCFVNSADQWRVIDIYRGGGGRWRSHEEKKASWEEEGSSVYDKITRVSHGASESPSSLLLFQAISHIIRAGGRREFWSPRIFVSSRG